MAVTWNVRCASWGIVSSVVAAGLIFSQCLSEETHPALRITAGAVAILLSISSLIAFHISSLRCSEGHTLRTLILSYMWHESERLATPSIIGKADHMWKHPRDVQENLIRRLTRQHAKSEYGRKHHLGEIRSLEDLRKKHPLTTYDHFADYIQRLADGEKGVFLDDMPVRFGITSGTTGARKLIPFGGFYLVGESFCLELLRLATYQCTSRPSSVQKRCYVYTHPKFSVTKTGLIVAPYTFITERDTLLFAEHSSPPPAFTISDEPTACYIHMLFAIADPNLALLSAIFTPQVYRALQSLETNWQAMLEDLSTGQINAKIPLAPDVRRSLQGYLRPDQGRVAKLRKEFEKGFDGIVRRIWPHLIAHEGINISRFREKLQEKYSKGVHCVNGFYGSTESGTPAINMWGREDEPRYVLMPRVAVFEFIPEQQSSEKHPKNSLLIHEVEIGGRYELVLTTRSGLYRYRTGDIIEVVRFHENCPVIRMLYRTGEYLNLVNEKSNTNVVGAAVSATIKSWPGLQLLDWTCAESVVYDPDNSELYYILFLEVDSGNGELNVTEEQRSKFDDCLQQSQYSYKTMRASSTISTARVLFVRPGTFSELRDFIAARTTASFNQYKSPRRLITREQIQLMMGRVVEADR